MLPRKQSKTYKSNQDTEDGDNYYMDTEDPKVRVLQYDLVFITGLPSFVASKQVLSKEIYLGRYGKVQKSILNPPYPYKKGVSYQVYATYENELNASLAVVALDGFALSDRPLKVSYGTTKYCSYFLRGQQCTNSDCFYLHKITRQNKVKNGDTRTVFRQQNDRAIQMVIENLQQIIQRILSSKIEHVKQGFPSLTQTIEYLIDNEFIDKKQYDQLYRKVRKNRLQVKQCKSQIVINIQNSSKLNDNKNENENSNVIQQSIINEQVPKLIKSNSFSTMASPSKPAASIQFDEEEKRINQIQNTIKKSLYRTDSFQDLQDRTVKSSNQNKKIIENFFDSEQIISQKLIKQIMKKKAIKSRFDFVSLSINNCEIMEQAKKIKNIIQRFLITYQ